jgi:hypothetical protein
MGMKKGRAYKVTAKIMRFSDYSSAATKESTRKEGICIAFASLLS